MDVLNKLPAEKAGIYESFISELFRRSKYYMTLTEVEADTTLIKAGERCNNIYLFFPGKYRY